MTPRFLDAIDFVLFHEGGYVFDSADPGGETNYGISKRSYPSVDIKNLTRDGAKEIYFKDWWEFFNYEAIQSTEIAKRLLDFSVTSYQPSAVRALQKALNLWKYDLDLDGNLGPLTCRALNEATKTHEAELIRAFCHYRARHYEVIANPRFERGWLLRAFA